jgi:hypothetical protein
LTAARRSCINGGMPAAPKPAATKQPAATKPEPARLAQLTREAITIVQTALVLWICDRSAHAPASLLDVTFGRTRNEALALWPVVTALQSYASLRRVVFVEEDRPALVELFHRAYLEAPAIRQNLIRAAVELPWADACEAISRELHSLDE